MWRGFRVSKLDHVEIWPPTGPPDAIWQSDGENEPILDAFLRSSRVTCELYSHALRESPLVGPRSMLRLGASVHEELSSVEVSVDPKAPRDVPGEVGWVRLCRSVGELTPTALSLLALRVIDAAMRHLAPYRGWEIVELGRCYSKVVSRDFKFETCGPWKSSPDRRWRARTRYQLLSGTGFGTCRIELEDTNRAHIPVVVGTPTPAFCSSEGFARSAKTLRWTSSSQVTVIPFCGQGRALYLGLSSAVKSGDEWEFVHHSPVSVRQPAGAGVASVHDRHSRLPDVTFKAW